MNEPHKILLKKPELSVPIKDFETLEAALIHGADAVYAGVGPYNLRTHAPAFDVTQFREAVQECHCRKKRIYAALNSMPSDSQMSGIEQILRQIADFKELPDAIIISDPGVLSACREIIPGVPLHLSTQTGCFNQRSASFWSGQGIKRIVLPREMSLEQISLINTSREYETEVFAHGAMCVSISGRCLMSLYLNGRHPNHGDCSQPCRLKYSICEMESDVKKGFFAEEDSEGTRLFNSADLNTISILDRVILSGVSALKIEGRNKSVHYLSTVVRIYRAAIDMVAEESAAYRVSDSWIEELNSIEHRPYTTGFYCGEYTVNSFELNKSSVPVRIAGIVKGQTEAGAYLVDVKNTFLTGEVLNVLPVSHRTEPFDISFAEIKNMSGTLVSRALTNRIVICLSKSNLREGDMLRKRVEAVASDDNA